ncbi:MAG: LuxR C-terminal-related transcriptional regulator [Gaiellaceae bacterium]
MFTASHSAVLLDRQPLWLEAVELVLGRIDVRVAGKATAPKQALELIGAYRPDVFVTGIEMDEGDIDGIECIAEARELVPGIRAVVLSAHTETEYIDRALDAGAVAYVVKSAHPDDLASAIRQAFQHSIYFAGSRPGPAPAWPAPTEASEVSDLTRREKEILQLVAEGHSNAKLAKMLWVTEQTVKFHLSNVYRKLDVSNRTEAARWAQLNGLLPASGYTLEDRRARLAAG